MNHKVQMILIMASSFVHPCKRSSRPCCIPSCSYGRDDERIGGLAENQTALEKLQWKKRWESFSRVQQCEQFLSILLDRLPALWPVASALLTRRQTKVLILGEMSLWLHTLLRISIDPDEMLLGPWDGSWTCKSLLRNLKASFVVQSPLEEWFHLIESLWSEGTGVRLWIMVEARSTSLKYTAKELRLHE